MLNLQIIKPGLHSTIQDGGRNGKAFYGIPRSGFMDMESAQIANLLVGNKKNSACIEMLQVGMEVYFDKSAVIGITGADMQATINGKVCPRYQTIVVNAGSLLKFRNAKSGSITYLAIAGKWKVSKVWGSVATCTTTGVGGLSGGLLKVGDSISIKSSKNDHVIIKYRDFPDYASLQKIKFVRGPEYDMLKHTAKNFKTKFSKSPQGNRMGVPLDGRLLKVNGKCGFKSQVIVPGMIQCTPEGKLIVILQDGQTTGGYPRIGMISQAELNKFNQIKPGVDFKLTLKL